MREIRFRAWNKHLKMMDLNVHRLDTLNEYIARENHIVMQYTGLKDKNGVEIYEGDILKQSFSRGVVGDIEHFIGEIKYCTDTFSLVDLKEEQLITIMSHCEVIGNIYENKELLENGE